MTQAPPYRLLSCHSLDDVADVRKGTHVFGLFLGPDNLGSRISEGSEKKQMITEIYYSDYGTPES